MKKKLTIGFMVFVLLISVLFISPKKEIDKSLYHSSQLNKRTTIEGNTERTDYLDIDGKPAIAADAGYATVVSLYGDKIKLEKYYDEKGEPIRRSSGYYSVFREYDDSGNNIQNTYLDLQGNPVVTLSGYAIEKREYNQDKQTVSIRYFDAEGYPATSISFEHGKNNEYGEDGKIHKTTYIDVSGNPVMIKQGYATIAYKYYTTEGSEDERGESEFYFDGEGNPVSLSLGEYGVHKEYDNLGRNNLLTYLDADGNPLITNKGYTSVVRSFQANNYAATERYLDINGDPFSLPEGQYGIRMTDGQTVFLDKNGNEQFNIRNFLYNHSSIIIIAAIVLVLLAAAFNRNWNIVFAILYFIAIVYLTLMFRENSGATLKLEPFWSYRKIMVDSEARADILKNIWLFIPLGAILYRIHPSGRMILIPLGLSILIEAIQYFAGTGFCELDDVISNTLGGLIGYEMEKLIADIKNRLFRKQQKL